MWHIRIEGGRGGEGEGEVGRGRADCPNSINKRYPNRSLSCVSNAMIVNNINRYLMTYRT